MKPILILTSLLTQLVLTCGLSGKCSMRTITMRMRKGMIIPFSSQISMNLMYEVAGSSEATEPFKVYMTNIEVMAKGMAVLKCSLKK